MDKLIPTEVSVKDWIDQIDKTTSHFTESFGKLSEEELNWRPNGNTWSVAQNVHHLIAINETYYPVIEKVRSNHLSLPWIAGIGFMVTFFGNVILKSVAPDRKKRMKTFPLWEPSSSNISGDILERFRHHQDELKNLIQSSADLLNRGTIISSPANRNIVYRLNTAFDILVTHEMRHYNQAMEVNDLRKKISAS